jgi:uncharacterized RDD family membrane protein YckC
MTERTADPAPAVGLAGLAEDPEPVGAVVRLVAYALDALLLVVLIYVVALMLRAVIGPTIRFTDADGVPRLLVDRLHVVINAVAATLVAGAWFVGSWLRFGGTPGQRVLGMRVVRVDGGGALGPGQAVGRWLLLGTPLGLISTLLGPPSTLSFILVVAIAFWFALLYVSTARGRRKRGIHDRITGTVVVRRSAARPPAGIAPEAPPAS